MSNKFKKGERVKCITPSVGISEGRVYYVSDSELNGVRLEGSTHWYDNACFEHITPQPNIPTGCKPFNYEEAIKDLSKVVTRGNIKVIELNKLNSAMGFYSVVGICDDDTTDILTWSIDGMFNSIFSESAYDLFIIN